MEGLEAVKLLHHVRKLIWEMGGTAGGSAAEMMPLTFGP